MVHTTDNSNNFVNLYKSIVFDQNKNAIDSNAPILATLEPIQTVPGDVVKLDAMVLINILTSGNGQPASHSSILTIQRDTLIPGSITPTSTIIVSAQILDTNLNNPAATTPLTRLTNLNWVDTPPLGISTYIFRVTSSASFNITGVVYTNRFLSAVVFYKCCCFSQ